MAMNKARANVRLPPEVNRVLYVRNLPYKITAEEMYDIFGKYGAIRQIRLVAKARVSSVLLIRMSRTLFTDWKCNKMSYVPCLCMFCYGIIFIRFIGFSNRKCGSFTALVVCLVNMWFGSQAS